VLIINEERLTGFISEHPEARSALERWAALTRTSRWKNLAEVRQVFKSADAVCECTVFNILGNNYRLITRIVYANQTVSLRYFLTHKEYDRGRWKKDCDC